MQVLLGLHRTKVSRNARQWSIRFFSSADTFPPSITLYQYSICPFCAKAKVLLEYLDLPYQAVEVNPLTKKQLKPWSGAYQKVPIAMIDGIQINGSDDIVSSLLQRNFVQTILENKWSRSDDMSMTLFTNGPNSMNSQHNYWTTEFANNLAAILYPNICRTWSDSYQAFGYVDRSPNTFSQLDKLLIRNIGSLAMTFAASKIKSIKDEREALLQALLHWERDGIKNGKVDFSSEKSHPNMADLTIFAVLYSCRDLPVHNELILGNNNLVLGEWYRRMQSVLFAAKK